MSEDHADRIGAIHRDLHSHLPPEPALRVKALESLLVEKGLLDPRTVDAWIEVYTEEIGPKRGAEIVARAWTDPRLQGAPPRRRAPPPSPRSASRAGPSGHLNAVENTPAIHNLVVCTLCSCYPHSILGIPPNWYKTAAYRSRAVRDPRGVVAEFGEAIPTMSRCGSGIRPPNSAISSSPSGPPAPRAGISPALPRWSAATR